jgi:DNA-binding transcriptional MocR family regulator
MSEKISIREFARRLNVSDTTIHKAIKAERIVKGYTEGAGRKSIDYEIAKREYNSTASPTRENRKPPRSAESSGITAQAVIPFDEGDPASMNAERLRKIKAEADLKELELKEKTGALTSRDEVYRELFAIGKELRVALVAIPDRVIDDLMASANRNEAHGILLRAISTVLEQASDRVGLVKA